MKEDEIQITPLIVEEAEEHLAIEKFRKTELGKLCSVGRKKHIQKICVCPKLSEVEIKNYNNDSRFKVFKTEK